jgi:hypothetical protein
MTSTSVVKKLREHRRAAIIFAALLLSTLVLAFALRPAWAIGGDPCPPICDPPENNPPSVDATNPSRTVNEGQTATNDGTYSDTDGNATVTLSASVGSVTKNLNGTWSWSFNTSDGPDQSQTVTITASDGTDTATTTFSLTVNNVAPTVNLQNGFPSAPEGGAFAKNYPSYGYNLSVSDPGNDTWTLNTGCGSNGSEWQESNFVVWCGFFDGPGSSTVSATATDSDGASRTASVLVDVTNINPVAQVDAPTSINEGSTATVSLTKGGFSYQDGETDTNAGFHYAFDCNGGSLSTATYANSGTDNSTTCPTTDNGTKTVRAKIMDKDGGSTEYTKSITVNNVSPTATFNTPTSVNQGDSFTLSLGSVVDPSSTDNLTYEFDCGNGSGYVPSSTPSKTCSAIDKPSLTVKGKVRDDDGGSNEYTANVTVNNVFPTGTIQINSGAATTNNAIVNLSLSASDPLPGSGIDEMRLRNENTPTWDGVAWENYTPSRQWQLSNGDGTKTVFVEFKDNAGNASQGVISDQILLDTSDSTAPVPSIDTGPDGPTSDNTPTFTFSGSDNVTAASNLLFSYKVDTGSWSSYFSDTSVTLGGATGLTDGSHTFFVRAKDQANNETSEANAAQQSFTVDTTPPNGPVVINGGATVTNNAAVNLTLNATDPSPGAVDKMRLSNDGETWSNWEDYATSKSWNLSGGDGMKTVFVEFQDGAGNTSTPPATDSIKLDTSAPTALNWSPKKTGTTRSKPTVFFSEKMDKSLVEAPGTFTLKKGTKAIGVTVAYVETLTGQYKAIMTPNSGLRSGVTYTVSMTAGAQDLAGNALDQNPNLAGNQPKTWRFTVK